MMSVFEAPTGAGLSLLGIASAPLDSAPTHIGAASAASAVAGADGVSTGTPMAEGIMRALINSSTMLRPVADEATPAAEEAVLAPHAEEAAPTTEEIVLARQQGHPGEVSSDFLARSGGGGSAAFSSNLTGYVQILARTLAMRPWSHDHHYNSVSAALHGVAGGDEVWGTLMPPPLHALHTLL